MNFKFLIRPRWLARLLARTLGYFWLPCPVCKEPFAGFEWGADIWTGDAGEGVCANQSCCEAADATRGRT